MRGSLSTPIDEVIERWQLHLDPNEREEFEKEVREAVREERSDAYDDALHDHYEAGGCA